MSRQSCIEHPAGDPFVMCRRDYMAICQKDACAAMLLSAFEEWTNSKLKNAEETPGDVWVYRTQEELAQIDLCEAFGRDRLTRGLDRLRALGFLERRHNPDPKHGYDRTYQYRLDRTSVQAAVDRFHRALDGLESQSRESDDGKRRHEYRVSEIRLSMDGDPLCNTSESTETPAETPTKKKWPSRSRDVGVGTTSSGEVS